MKIIETRMAPNPRRVRIFLAEKGIEVPFEQVDLMKGDLKTDTFTKLNRLQRVPVLVLDDGTSLCESIAICRYFEELHPEPPLFGVGAVGKARVEMWQRRLELNFLVTIANAFRHIHPAMKEWEVPQMPEWGEINKPKAVEFMALFDKELASREFAAGDAYSVADITGLVAMDFLKPARIAVPEEFSNLRRWHEALKARPSADA